MKKFIPVVILLLVSTECVLSQSVSLVLSGGGAKGLAHIGVIKALEDNGIPIDNVSGTSMGAIIGGLYSAGYSPDDMMALFKDRDFYSWSNGIISDEYKFNINDLSLTDAENVSIGLSIGRKGVKPRLVSNFIPTVGMDIAFDELFDRSNAFAGGNFDSLFVPFRCNASDVVKKHTVYFRRGNLGRAVRASMTFPLYFMPIYIDSVLLFDGGIYNNFLWREAYREFSPDVIVGSKVASNSKYPKPDEPLTQLEAMIVGLTDYNIPDSLGLVIDTHFSDVGLFDFQKIDQIFKAGYDNALKVIPEIKRRVTRRVKPEQVAQRRKAFIDSLPPLYIGKIHLSGVTKRQARYINRLVFNRYSVITFDKFKQVYYRLMSDRVFKRLEPTIHYNRETNLFDVFMRPQLKRTVDLGLGHSLSSDMGNEGFLSLNYNWLTATSNTIYGNIYFGKLYSSARVSLIKTFPARKPVSLMANFLANRIDYHSGNPIPFYEDTKPAYVVQDEVFASALLSISHNSALNTVLAYSIGKKIDDYYQVEKYYSYDVPDRTEFDFTKLAIRIEKNTLNAKLYATRGRKQVVCLSSYWGVEKHFPGTTAPSLVNSSHRHNFITLYLHNESYHRLTNRLWMEFYIDGYYSTQGDFSNYYSTILALNQFSPTVHSKSLYLERYRSSKYIAVGVAPIWEFGKNMHARFEAYLFQPYRSIGVTQDGTIEMGEPFSHRWLIGNVSLVFSTPLGPVTASVAYYPSNGKKELYANLSFGYLIFNPRVFDN